MNSFAPLAQSIRDRILALAQVTPRLMAALKARGLA